MTRRKKQPGVTKNRHFETGHNKLYVVWVPTISEFVVHFTADDLKGKGNILVLVEDEGKVFFSGSHDVIRDLGNNLGKSLNAAKDEMKGVGITEYWSSSLAYLRKAMRASTVLTKVDVEKYHEIIIDIVKCALEIE